MVFDTISFNTHNAVNGFFALCFRCLDSSEEIDLINVAFEQKTDGRTK